MSIPKEDNRPKRYLWAPGDYYCECFHCKELFIGDKRATTCADCAYKDWPEPEKTALTPATGEGK